MKLELNNEKKEHETQAQQRKEELAAQQRKEELEAQAQQRKDELETQQRKEELALKHEREMRALELNARRIAHEESIATKFDLDKNVQLVAPFNESEVDKYFQHFKRVAQNLKWPTDQWPLLQQSVLKAKAKETYTALPIAECVDYNCVKNAILKVGTRSISSKIQKLLLIRKLNSC